MNADLFHARARVTTNNRLMRRGFVGAIMELEHALMSALASNRDLVSELSQARSDLKRLNATVMNYEKIVSARDRFGCWLCAKHEKDSVHSDDDQDEKEALRNENLGLREKVKRLESSLETRPRVCLQEETLLRSSMRSSEDSGSHQKTRTTRRHIKFQGLIGQRASEGRSSRISMASASGRSSMGSSQDDQPLNRSSASSNRFRVSFEEPVVSPIPESPLTATLGRTTSVPGGPRKTRTKQVLFSSQPQVASTPWAIKYSPAVSEQNPKDNPVYSEIASILSSIPVIQAKSLFDQPGGDDIQTLAKSMTLVKVDLGDTVSKQGEPGLFFMIVKSGEFVCESIGHPSRDLRKGDYFGEEIFIHPAPLATVSVTCTFAGELWAIYTDALRKVLRSLSARHMHVIRGTLEWLPKQLRDSINSSQFDSICKAADTVVIEAGKNLDSEKNFSHGLLVVVDAVLARGTAAIPQHVSKGAVIVNPIGLVVVEKSTFVFVNQREIESIPPLAIARNSLIIFPEDGDSGDDIADYPWMISGNMPVPGSTRMRRVQLNTIDMSSPVSEFELPDQTATTTTPHAMPLSPSLRPAFTETDISNIPLFGLLSISARTHLMNRAKFLRIGEEKCTVDLGIICIMNGTATVRDPVSMKSVSLDQGHSIGMGSNTLFSTGEIELFADNNAAMLDQEDDVFSGTRQSLVVVAYWSDETIRQSLPSAIREEKVEANLVSYLKRRKLLLKNPLFQFLHERGLERIITEARNVYLDHNKSVLVELATENEGFVVIEGQAKVGDRIVQVGDFYNCENLLSGIENTPRAGNDSLSLGPIAATYLVSAYTVSATIIVVSRELYMGIFDSEVSDSEIVKNRIRGYIAEIRQRLELSDLKVGKVIGRGGTAVVKIASVAREDTLYALKIIKKKFLEYHNKYQMLKNEKQVLQSLNKSTFVIKLRQTFKDDRNLYFLLELAPGGDLLSVLNKLGVLDRHQAQFYLGCMIEALKYCHENSVVYRDLKPENLLVDSQGYLKLSDFGIAKKFSKQNFLLTYSLVGTPQFMAPEILTGHGYGFTVDLWSLGCCLFELLVGELPFQSDDLEGGNDTGNQFRLFQSIVAFNPSAIDFADTINEPSRSLIRGLLQPNPHNRLGCSVGAGIGEIQRHEFFEFFAWDKLRERSLEAPFVPEIAQVMVKRPASVEGFGIGEEPPLSSPALSAAPSYSSFEPGAHAPSVWSVAPRDTAMSWDLNF